ncbi:MAG: VWA domain-containing protein [Planctomycetota bacterium]
MQFAQPLFLAVGAVACGLLLWLSRRLARSRTAALREMAADRLVAGLTESVSPAKRRIRLGLLVIAVAALFAALARPQAGFRWEESRRRGIDIMLALDTSRSMLARDVAPDRLERAKLSILDLLEKLEGDRVGLIPFAGEAYLMCPLTLDYDAFRQSLATADTEIVPAPGSDLANAIRVGTKALDAESNHRILVIVTDGEDLEGEAVAEAKRAAAAGVTVHTVGVGTPAGELVPADGGFLRDEKGELVRSRLDEKTLSEIATATGGIYEPIAGGLDAIYRQKLSLVPKEELMARRHKVPLERFEWALGLGGLALLLEMLLGDRRAPRAWRLPRLGRAAAGAAVLLAASVAHASPQEGEKAFREGEFEDAAAEYRGALESAPADARLHQGLAAASYKKGDFDAAAESYRRAIRTEDLKLQNEAYYGLGNTLFRQGQQGKDAAQTTAKWEEALTQYEGALKLDPEDEDARFNRDLVRRKLEELKKQQEQQKQQDQQQKDQQQQAGQSDPQQKESQQAGESPQQQKQQQDPQQGQQAGDSADDRPQSTGPQDRGPQQDPQQQQKDQQQQESQQGEQAGDSASDMPRPTGQQDRDPQQDQQQQQQKDQQQAGHEGQHRDQQQAGQGPEPREGEGKDQKQDGQQAEPQDGDGKQEGKPRNRLDPGEEKPGGEAGKAPSAEPAEGAGRSEGAEGSGGDAEARVPGRMTREQARQLLDSLREGEGQLAFVPQHGNRNKRSGKHRRDW